MYPEVIVVAGSNRSESLSHGAVFRRGKPFFGPSVGSASEVVTPALHNSGMGRSHIGSKKSVASADGSEGGSSESNGRGVPVHVKTQQKWLSNGVAPWPQYTHRTPLNLAICIGGVLGSLCVYGVLQERIMTVPYYGGSEQAEMFKCSIFLVLMNRLVTVCISSIGMVLTSDSFETSTPIALYATIAFSNLVATVCQYEVLKYLSFAASTLVKCAKIIPVMIWGTFILRKRYTAMEFVSAGAVTLGCFMFILDRGVLKEDRQWMDGTGGGDDVVAPVPAPAPAPPSKSAWGGAGGSVLKLDDLNDVMHPEAWFESVRPHSALHQMILGGVIMIVYLGFDGFTSTFQQKLFRQYTTSILNQIFFTTAFSSIFSLVWLLSTSQLSSVTEFVRKHPQVVPDIFVLSVAACVSQFAISYTIFCFGAVTLASVMTCRQFISVLMSCFLFGHPLTGVQWLGVLLVLAPVVHRMYQERKRPELFEGHESGEEGGGPTVEYRSIDESPRPGTGYGGIESWMGGSANIDSDRMGDSERRTYPFTSNV